MNRIIKKVGESHHLKKLVDNTDGIMYNRNTLKSVRYFGYRNGKTLRIAGYETAETGRLREPQNMRLRKMGISQNPVKDREGIAGKRN